MGHLKFRTASASPNVVPPPLLFFRPNHYPRFGNIAGRSSNSLTLLFLPCKILGYRIVNALVGHDRQHEPHEPSLTSRCSFAAVSFLNGRRLCRPVDLHRAQRRNQRDAMTCFFGRPSRRTMVHFQPWSRCPINYIHKRNLLVSTLSSIRVYNYQAAAQKYAKGKSRSHPLFSIRPPHSLLRARPWCRLGNTIRLPWCLDVPKKRPRCMKEWNPCRVRWSGEFGHSDSMQPASVKTCLQHRE